MDFPSIRIEGNIFSFDILSKIENGEDIKGQSSKDFGFDASVKVKDEIAMAWADANSLWRVFINRVDNLKENDSGTLETRRYWIIPLLGLLGYELETNKSAHIINGKNYAVSHYAADKNSFPVHIAGVNDSLDRKRESGGPRMSPHALVQEYLNLSEEHLYAIISNGLTLRLLRDSSRLVKLSYIEFDLEKIFTEDHFTDFALMFRLLHASRMADGKIPASESLIEQYHLDALESGERIRNGLSSAVERSIIAFANGFLNNPENKELADELLRDSERVREFHNEMLRLIYRILFLMVIEERGLVYPEGADADLRNIYYDHYSVSSLRKLCELRHISSEGYDDLWIRLMNTFILFEDEKYGRHLRIKPLAGDLFSERSVSMIRNCRLGNDVLLKCFGNLNYYTNEKGLPFRVNYAALSVEEFGSVYEGLLEYEPRVVRNGGHSSFTLVKGSERAVSGSHYTPDELVQPLIKHSLDHVIEDKLKTKEKKEKEMNLLSITVCDVACGSGHILLNAARRIAIELARTRTGEDQPNPPEFRRALKDVISNCIYGVDKNPLAVELCKVALWLESHNPGEPLNFLDHKIKCGDSIAGLAFKEELEEGIPSEAFTALAVDDKTIASKLRKQNYAEVKDRQGGKIKFDFEGTVGSDVKKITKALDGITAMPEATPGEVEAKKKSYEEFSGSPAFHHLQALCDIKTAQFFIAKNKDNEGRLITDGKFSEYLCENKQMTGPAVGKAMAVGRERKFFHWFIEFPGVMERGGFDCILGNPPFLGGQKLSGTFGDSYLEYIKHQYDPIGAVDLVTYFFRRIFSIINANGFLSLISTNTIAQGKAREFGLDIICKSGGTINHAVRSMRWPGAAAVEVALVTITKRKWKGKFYLGSKEVGTITPYLDDSETLGNPYPLKQNEGKSFQGSIVLGKGFILEPEQAKALIHKDTKNKDVLFPYLNGEDLNNNPDQSASRWVINFFDWEEDYCRENYPDCFEIVERLVKPERMLLNESKNSTSSNRKKYWWRFGSDAKTLYRTIKDMERVLVVAQVSKTLAFELTRNDKVLDAKLVVFSIGSFSSFCIMQSNIHNSWAWTYCTTMKSDLSYTPTAIFQTFALPNSNLNECESFGLRFYELRSDFMKATTFGLTKTYNLFHSKGITIEEVNESDKHVELLKKHLERTPGTVSIEEAIQGIRRLRELHIEMDNAVLAAYGWSDIDLRHDFYEVDYLPENDRVRFTIHPEARREVLKRLLELNHKIHEEEVKAGLWEKGAKKKSKKTKADRVGEDEGQYSLM